MSALSSTPFSSRTRHLASSMVPSASRGRSVTPLASPSCVTRDARQSSPTKRRRRSVLDSAGSPLGPSGRMKSFTSWWRREIAQSSQNARLECPRVYRPRPLGARTSSRWVVGSIESLSLDPAHIPRCRLDRAAGCPPSRLRGHKHIAPTPPPTDVHPGLFPPRSQTPGTGASGSCRRSAVVVDAAASSTSPRTMHRPPPT